jgi:L-aspartate oxidase
MERYSPLLELAPRDVVSKAIHSEMISCGEDYVYLELSHMDQEFVRKRFSNIGKLCRDLGFDLAKDRIPVAPAAHYTIGGWGLSLSMLPPILVNTSSAIDTVIH